MQIYINVPGGRDLKGAAARFDRVRALQAMLSPAERLIGSSREALCNIGIR